MKASVSSGLLLILLLAVLPAAGKEIHATVVYDDVATGIDSAREDSDQLWITTADLTRATRFAVKPQGVCRDVLCFPLPKAKKQEFLHQDAVRSDQSQTLSSLYAPDFTLPDINGKQHSLSDFRGKKILLVTWASW